MFKSFARKVFGSENERYLKRIRPLISQINGLEEKISKMSDDELKNQTVLFRERLGNGENLNHLLPEAFATVRETGIRTLGMRHYDVQMIGGIVLHDGRIAEMKTGEGKTLVATLPMYLNALEGKGTHLVTVNDYLAKRDAEWMGQIYRFLGLNVATVVNGMSTKAKRAAYAADITYGTNNEFGFDYLRDNMKFELEHYVQRDLHYAIVDEVDSILIDEARTPLIISGPSDESTDLYAKISEIMPYLEDVTHFEKDEKTKNAVLTEEGIHKVERLIGIDNLYSPENLEIVHHVQQALKAQFMFHRDVDYVVKEEKVLIVDEFTGRLMDGRRYSDGLHQALEAKEKVKIERENQTLATITFQNYFRMYNKLSGMTGTADTEAAEFAEIYNLGVIVIPTNKPVIRKDAGDLIYKTEKAKNEAIIKDVEERYKAGQPVLVGTISVEKSEELSELLTKRKISHNVLNAKFHMKEADIVAQAGRSGAITIATNMAGRGTDIMLGGNPELLAKNSVTFEDIENHTEEYLQAIENYKRICAEEKEKVKQAGGLHIIGTERHESRRIDNQLRGRSGRQGDPGSSRFYLSLDDDLLRIFGGERISGMMDRLGIEENQPIEHKWISKAVENAQKKVEAHNFSIRKNVLEYDDVMNQQRKTIYDLRKKLLLGKESRDLALSMLDEVVAFAVDNVIPERAQQSSWDFESLAELLARFTQIAPENFDFMKNENIFSIKNARDARNELAQQIYTFLESKYNEKMDGFGEELSKGLERHITLEVLDHYWRRHLLDMDHLREGIGLRGYGQKNPKLEYKREGYSLFTAMISNIYGESVKRLFAVQIVTEENIEEMEKKEAEKDKKIRTSSNVAAAPKEPEKRKTPKVGRNDPCPCGSGKKYKKCCMEKGIYE